MAGGFFQKRDAVFAIAAGTLIAVALNTCYRLVAGPDTIDRYLWLARLQQPAASLAERMARTVYPTFGYPWSARCAVAFGYVVLVSTWVAVVFSALKIGRLIARRDSQFRGLLLLSAAICGAGYLGLALTGVAVYSPLGMTWSLVVLATWIITIVIAFRRCGKKAAWLLLQAPVVLLPFYGVFLVDL